MQISRAGCCPVANSLFATDWGVLLDAPNKKWIFANAGHVLPLLRRSTGVVSRVAYSSGPPLGIVAHAQYREETISVAAAIERIAAAIPEPGAR